MLFANVNGEKVEATPNTTGICPLCGQLVFSRCGDINDWHWSHHKDETCDSWYEPETAWHKNWKLVFGKEHSEVIITKDDIKHIADIRTEKNVIIELQNSPIQRPIISQREDFYGERLIWIINGKTFKDNFQYRRTRSAQLDADDEYYHRYNPLASKYNTHPRKEEYSFTWNWCRRSWTDTQRPVFIDFGDENLFHIEEGMGRKSGIGRPISKERFINKYGGNIELLESVIDTSHSCNSVISKF
jgi:competence protein CoiA